MKAIPADTVSIRDKPSNYPEPFASMMKGRIKRPLGDAFGLQNFGVNLTDLSPRSISALLHEHSKQDEFIYILEGHPTLVTSEGTQVLSPHMCMGFRAANGVAHQLINETDQMVRYLEIGDRTAGDSGSYPNDDLIAVLESGIWRFTHKDGTPY